MSTALQVSQQTNDTVDALLPQSTQSHQSTLPERSSPVTRAYGEHPELPTLQLDVCESQTGRVFELTLQDAQAIVMSDQVLGGVWLTEPYRSQSLPSITITVSEELCAYFSAQRNRVM